MKEILRSMLSGSFLCTYSNNISNFRMTFCVSFLTVLGSEEFLNSYFQFYEKNLQLGFGQNR